MNRYTVVNKSGETMPPFGIGKIVSIESRTGVSTNVPVFRLEKPDGESGIYVVNGPVELPNNGRRGMIPWEQATVVAIDTTQTVGHGDTIGPVSGSWRCSTAGLGYICQDAKQTDDIVSVHFTPATTGGSGGGGDCGCGCICADGFDVTLPDGTKTTKIMRWTPTSVIEIDVPNGHIWLPQGVVQPDLASYFPLQYVTASEGIWTLDLAPHLLARRTDTVDPETDELIRGEDVSVGVTKTGTATYRRTDSSNPEKTSLTVEINGTIPAP